MTIHFSLRYRSSFGQTLLVSGNFEAMAPGPIRIPLTYLNENFWYASLEIKQPLVSAPVHYWYSLKDIDGLEVTEAETARNIYFPGTKKQDLTLIDTWNGEEVIDNVFLSKPFKEILLTPQSKIPKLKPSTDPTHEFKIKAPLLCPDEWVCISGTGATFKNWDVQQLIPMQQQSEWFSVKLNLSKDKFPLRYKYGVYNIHSKTFEFEIGEDRVLTDAPVKNNTTVLHDGFVWVKRFWKGAGVAIPVFSLRSKKSFGIGEFADIKLLADWAVETGLSLIQLLPISDTTATSSWLDSYPYAAISAFALHPLYIRLENVAGSKYASVIEPLKRKQRQLNNLAAYDYEQVLKFKLAALRELYELKKEALKIDPDYLNFFELNRNWLVPYAAFCYLRDKNSTSDFTKWKTHQVYESDAINKLTAPSQKQYDKIAFFYFVQYHLHLQLNEAVVYAHKKKIIIKGDIPIGIYRYGCDAWMNPELYNMDEQAGAPPDDFAVKGQNWGFPTYNWQKMQEDNFLWWRNRFHQMSNYFDAFRIDHVLGFFRIWSIPSNAVEGVMGRFIPAIPINVNEFTQKGIWFNRDRYCKPFITDSIVTEVFNEESVYVKNKFLDVFDDVYHLKEQYNTQRKVEEHFHLNPAEKEFIKQGLYNLISNVILIKDKENSTSNEDQFHFRIAMDKTASYNQLASETKQQLFDLYIDYFFRRQDVFWKREAMKKLPELKHSTNMLVCGEDLGMVPDCVPDVMRRLGILSLEIQRMPKNPATEFFHPKDAPYLSVVTPSTHDMSTIRGWWQEDRNNTQKFYNYILGHYGIAPFFCEPWINKEIILQHLYSPAMWSIFQVQDILGMSETLRRENPDEERINIPSDPKHYWGYRMHINLEDLVKQKEFNKDLKTKIKESGR
ncbi:MAG: 4-alpha-glucanotransferase [Chitinophagaceae bacterium]|nr:4-alpha-glucanotransferase [Chitinophagaceae bacterium]